jgi:mercuric ion transport protein
MSGATLKRTLVALPGVGVSLFPKLMCPACWPAYAGIVSALGLGFLVSAKYLLLLTAAFLSITLASLGFRASRRQGYGPLWMGIFASAIILGGKFYFELPQLTYAGLGLLIAASVWNSWPQRAAKASFCSACVPAEAGFNQGNTHGEPLHEAQNRSV